MVKKAAILRKKTASAVDEKFNRLAQKEAAFLGRVRQILDENLENEHFDIAALCQAMLMSRMQLHRKLTALSGRPATLFIRSHRLGKAVELLETTGLSVSEIAFKTGFSNPAYFSRCFKEEFGKPPSEWRAG